MFTGFDLRLGNIQFTSSDVIAGTLLNSEHQEFVKDTLKSFVIGNGFLDATLMQENWFPIINAHIFISHSHADREKAVGLAGWLFNNFKLVSFIDSSVWGYADDLLKLIDDAHCKNSHSDTYSYEKRNRSTAHVHMILSTALTMMIDKAECLFFLNTPNSIALADSISEAENKTLSPWIYSEIAMTKLINLRSRELHRGWRVKAAMEESVILDSLKVLYNISTDHLADLSWQDLTKIKIKADMHSMQKTDVLDALYLLKNVIE